MFTDEELEHILKALKHLYKNTISSKNQKKIRLSIINKIEILLLSPLLISIFF